MSKTQTVSKLKKKLDALFSQYVRRKDADHLGFISCYTCGVSKHYKEMHAGHFMSRKHLMTRWHLTNVKPQCPGCNLFRAGEQYKFAIYLDQREGEGTAQEMLRLSNLTRKMNKLDYLDEIRAAKELVESLD